MNESTASTTWVRGPGRTRSRSRATALKVALLATALIAALLTVTASAAEHSDPIVGGTLEDIGTLELFASDVSIDDAPNGDGVLFRDLAAEIQSREFFTSGSRSKLEETGLPYDLVTLSTPGAGSQLYVGLKNHLFGVRAKGEGNGTPASQINGDQKLTIALDGVNLPGSGANFAEFGVKLKFGATVRIEAFDTDGKIVAESVFACDSPSGDCGSDSGGDRSKVQLPSNGIPLTTPFTYVEITIDSPTDGAASLLDERDFDTFFNIVKEFDGTLKCGEAAEQSNGEEFYSSFLRLNVPAVVAGCIYAKPYNHDILTDEGRIQFEPDSAVPAIYRGDLTFPAGSGDEFLAALEYDADGVGATLDFEKMSICGIRDAATLEESDYFEELKLLGPTSGANGFPTMPTGETSCVVSFSSVIGGAEEWVIRLDGDPWYR